jgi:hypothetical protein
MMMAMWRGMEVSLMSRPRLGRGDEVGMKGG